MLRFADRPHGDADRHRTPERNSDHRNLPARTRRSPATAAQASRSKPPVPAAIGNAFFDATGVRMRQIPLTPAKVRRP